MLDTDIHIFASLAERTARGAPAKDLRTIAGFLPEPEKALKAAKKMVEVLEKEIAFQTKKTK